MNTIHPSLLTVLFALMALSCALKKQTFPAPLLRLSAIAPTENGAPSPPVTVATHTFSVPLTALTHPESASQLAIITVLCHGTWQVAPHAPAHISLHLHHNTSFLNTLPTPTLFYLMHALFGHDPSAHAPAPLRERATALQRSGGDAQAQGHEEISQSASQLKRDKKRLADYVRDVMLNKEGLYPTDADKYLEIRRAMLLLRLPR